MSLSPSSQRFPRVAIACALTALAATFSPATSHAESVEQLASTLTTSKRAKARIAAAVSIGRLKDQRALRPLIIALKDDNQIVRAVAATALGHLADSTALPALQRATRDTDQTVRRRAVEAIGEIRRLQADAKQGKGDKSRRVPNELGPTSYAISAREAPRYLPAKPELYVILKSAADESQGKAKKKVRTARAKKMKQLISQSLDASPQVTTNSTIAKSHGLQAYGIDVSIMSFDRRVAGPYVEIECELRVAVSNQRGKMLSFLTGGAKVQVPKRTFRQQYEPRLKTEALENAVKGIHQDVIIYLSKNPS